MPYDSVADLPANVKNKPAKVQRQWMAVFNSAFASCMKDEFGSTAKCESSAFAQANGVIKDSKKASESMQMQLEKAAPQVNYRYAEPGAEKNCGNCRFFWSGEMRCAVVEGSIGADYVSDLWTPRIATMPSYYHEQDYGIFVEAPFKAGEDYSSPRWIPFLPKPGVYKHKKYGDVEITPERNQAMVASVKGHVYQDHIPIDAEHQSKLSGAVAWLKDMRMNDDGSADAFVEFTSRGQTLLETDSFRYVSPEWFDEWPDPVSGKIHTDVVVGGAITTRPFFKDKALRALVASEEGVTFVDKEEPMPGTDTDPKVTDPKVATDPAADPKVTDPKADPAAAAKTFTEDEVKAQIAAAVEAAKAETTTAVEKTFAEQLADEKKAREAAELRVTKIETTDRIRRFTEMVAGRGGAGDGAAWAGNPEAQVGLLDSLAEKFGEDSDEFKAYVETQMAVAQQVKTAIFTEHGVTGAPSGDTPEAKIEALVSKRMAEAEKEGKPISRPKAYTEVMETDEAKKLYQSA